MITNDSLILHYSNHPSINHSMETDSSGKIDRGRMDRWIDCLIIIILFVVLSFGKDCVQESLSKSDMILQLSHTIIPYNICCLSYTWSDKDRIETVTVTGHTVLVFVLVLAHNIIIFI